MPPSLAVHHLSFRYRQRPDRTLQEVSFEVSPGQILLVAGPSGGGKTTLVRCLNGLIPRSYPGELAGEIWVQGRELKELSIADIAQEIGTVLQDPERQIVASHVHQEIAFGLENLGLPADQIRARVEEALATLQIAHLRERETFTLSGGEKQLLAITGALAMRASILLLDEPLANLDPESGWQVLRTLRRLADQGITTILVEHRVEDVLSIHPDLALYLDQGRCAYFGSLQGFLSMADPRQVKLPAPLALKRWRTLGEAPSQPVFPARPVLAEPIISLQKVSFAYDGQAVLRGIDLEIRAGEVVALLGPNGAGKSTLAKHLMGLLVPQEGLVRVAGQDTRKATVAQVARTVGYVFQSPRYMLFAPTVREELRFGPQNLGYSPLEIEVRVRAALQGTHLEGLEGESPLALSFGQQKRVTIAAVMAMGSRLLVLDEPTAGQDYRSYTAFLDFILELGAFEAVVLITHDLDLALGYANRVLLLRQGQLVADGPPSRILADQELLRDCRLRPTSLLALNLSQRGGGESFQRLEGFVLEEAGQPRP